jgi:hypothetical protein
VSRIWRNTLLFVAVVGAAGQAIARDFWPVNVLGALLLSYALIPVAYLAVPLLRRRRPAAAVIYVGRGFGTAALILWVLSMLLSIQIKASPNDAWILGSGALRHELFSTIRGAPRFANAPSVNVRFDPTLMPLGGTYRAMGSGPGVSSRTVSWSTWPLPAATLLPAVVLGRLRRERIPVGRCLKCEYDLTGNMSGRCPECGEAFDRESCPVE